MKRALACVIALACGGREKTTTTMTPPPARDASTALVAPTAPPTPTTPPAPLACVARFYTGVARRDGDAWSLVLPDGTAIPYDDGRTKTVIERFESPDVEDLFELTYKTGPIHPVTEIDFDPGRIRVDPIFFATYGKTAKDVEVSLVRVSLGGKTFLVHQKIKAPLERVARRIDAAMKTDPGLVKFFESPGGTFNWRKIAGSDQLSMHSWAIAIDLDTTRAHYWRNEPRDKPLVWKSSYPQAIVDAFEAEGFAWGGRWYHFDTMHFEYRPELLDPTCYPTR